MPSTLHTVMELAERQSWTVSRAQALQCGMSVQQIDSLVRRGHWLLLVRGFYLVEASMYEAVPFEVKARAALAAHPGAVLAGRSACRVMGLHGLPLDGAVHVVGAPATSRPPRSGAVTVQLRQWSDPQPDAQVVNGWPCTSVTRSLADAGLELDRPSALALLDSALHAGLVSPPDLALIEAHARGRRGSLALRALLPLADGRAESALESRVRLVCIDGKLPPDELQHEVYDRDVLVARGDLAWRKRSGQWLLAEADGREPHDREASVTRDRRRANLLTVEARALVRFTHADAVRPAYLTWVVRNALAA